MTDFSDFIKFFYEIERDVFDVLEEHTLGSDGGYLSAFSTNVRDFNFNHVVPIGKVKVDDVMVAATEEFDVRNREHIAYVTPLCDEYYSDKNHGLQLISTDAWMFFNGKRIKKDTKSSDVTVRVATMKDIDDYIKVYFDGFSDGVYADMESGFDTTERKSFNNPYKTKLMAFYRGKPVGVVSVDVKGDMGYIESFAILKQYRYGGETAWVLGNAAIDMCYDKGANKIFLITAAGTSLERLYQSVGFSTEFYGCFYKWCK